MMTTRRFTLVATALLCGALGLGAGEARAQGADPAADAFQRSYDTEAVGKLAESLAALDQLPAAKQGSYVAQYRRGWLLYRLGKYNESVEAYKAAIAAAPRAVEARVGILLPDMALRRWSDVESQARGALRVDPANYLATLRLAFALYNLHRYEEAAGHYRKLNELYPSDVEVISGLGWSLLKMSKGADAAARFREVLEIAPRHALAKEGLKIASSGTAGRKRPRRAK